MTEGIRKHRIAGTIRKHLSAELSREVADPRLFSMAISDVSVTADLTIATVSVRLMFGGEDAKARNEAMAALRKIGPGLRSSIAPILRMRRVPELRFVYDEAADMRAEIEGVLDEIKREDEQKRAALASEEHDPEDTE